MKSKRLILPVLVVFAGFLPQSKASFTGDLDSAGSFAILGGSAVTFTAPMNTVNGDVGVSPGSSITGAGVGENLTLTGTIHNNDGVAAQAQFDATAAYLAAKGASVPFGNTIPNLIGTRTLSPGVYNFVTPTDPAKLTDTLTLSGSGLFVFQVGADLQTTIGSSVEFINGAQACHVFWQVGSSANLLGADFDGTILALTSITLGDGVTVHGRLLAQTGNVTLIHDTITVPTCVPVPEPTTMIAGALLLLPFGMSTVRYLRKKRKA